MEVLLIHPAEFAERCNQNKNVELIDVRTPAEYQEVHVAAASNLPLDKLDPQAVIHERQGRADQPLYIICRSGSRAKQACEKFIQAGYTNVFNVAGGTLACVDAGLPVVRGKKTISLERQVRMAAGTLIVLGVILAWLIHPALILICAFVGAGLIFAGLTDTCGMGMLLARMPWNRGDGPAASCSTR